MTTNVHYHYHHSHCWNTHRLTSKALPIKSFSEVWLEIPVTRYKLTSSTKVLFFLVTSSAEPWRKLGTSYINTDSFLDTGSLSFSSPEELAPNHRTNLMNSLSHFSPYGFSGKKSIKIYYFCFSFSFYLTTWIFPTRVFGSTQDSPSSQALQT